MGALGHAAHQGGEWSAQPQADGIAPHHAAGFRVHEGAAAGGQHHRLAGQQAADHPAFPGAELRLAETREHFGDGAAGGHLDLGVGVVERESHTGRQPAADRGFAGAHQADKNDGTPGDPRRQAQGLLTQGVGICGV